MIGPSGLKRPIEQDFWNRTFDSPTLNICRQTFLSLRQNPQTQNSQAPKRESALTSVRPLALILIAETRVRESEEEYAAPINKHTEKHRWGKSELIYKDSYSTARQEG